MSREIKNFDGVYIVGWQNMIEMTNYIAHCNVYAFEYKDGFILVDCGNGFTGREILKNVNEISSKKITHIFLTHCHYDHSLNSLFFKENNSKIVSHINCADSFVNKTYRIWYEYPHLVKPFKVDIIFDNDKKINIGEIEILCLYTPGHTMGCASYFINLNNKKFLFTGDLIMRDGEIGWTGSEDFNKYELIKSLKKIEKIDFDFILGGHSYFDKKEGRKNIKLAIEKREGE